MKLQHTLRGPRLVQRPGRSVTALLLAALAWPGSAGAQEAAAPAPPGLDLPVVEATLENGLRLLALQRPGAPTVSFVLRFEVGGADEVLGETGLAHLLEHLVFKGTTTIGTTSLADELVLFDAMDAVHDSLLAIRGLRGEDGARVRLTRRIEALEDSARTFVVANELDRLLTENGARDTNATTDHEATTYFSRLPANRAELWFVLEADRLANPIFREFYAERDVVAEERRTRIEATGAGRLSEEFYAAAYRVHPYGVPVIGHMSDILTHTREEVESFHARYYVPNNAVMAVVGDVEPERVIRWARRYFEDIPAGPDPPRVVASEPPQRGERRIRVVFDAEPELFVGWHVPDGYHEDAPALTVLSRILTGGKTSRLYRRLVAGDQLATSVAAGIGPGFRGPRLFTLSAQPMSGRGTPELEEAIYAEIQRLIDEPPSVEELARVRNQIESGEVRRLASNFGLAFQLAESLAYHGDWKETFRTGERLAEVTSAEIQRVARKYLTEDNRTVGELVRAGAPAVDGRTTPGEER